MAITENPSKFKPTKVISKESISHKPRKNKLLTKKERKQNKKLKLSKKPNANIISDVKIIWKHNFNKMEKNKRQKIVSEIIEKMKGKIVEVISKHEVSRALEICIKHSNLKYVKIIFDEIKTKFVEFSMDPYARFVIRSILNFVGTHNTLPIHKIFYGNCEKLLTHRYSSTIIDLFYRNNCNNTQRMIMLQEFFYPRVLRPSFNELISQNPQKLHFKDILEKFPQKQNLLLKNFDTFIKKIVSKEMLTTAFSHHLLFEFLMNCSIEQEKCLFDQIIAFPLLLAQSKLGCRVVVFLISFSNTKQRKTLLKTLKGHVKEMSEDQFGWWIISRSLGVVDDTVLLKKIICSELIDSLNNSENFLTNENIQKLFLQFLNPNCPRFTPQLEKDILPFAVDKDSDETDKKISFEKRKTSKKDSKTRKCELLSVLRLPLINCATKKISLLMETVLGRELVSEILFECCSSKLLDEIKLFLDTVLSWIDSEKFQKNDVKQVRFVSRLIPILAKFNNENEISSYFIKNMIKMIIKSDKNKENNSKFKNWLNSLSVFVLCSLIEQKQVIKSKEKLKTHLTPFIKKLREDKTPGILRLIESFDQN